MTRLQDIDAKVCLTAAGCLIHKGKVLLVKHKKLGIWLNPGGHIEDNELPHQAAEREFWEETGVKVAAMDSSLPEQIPDGSEYLPSPFCTNLHWISKENYAHRTQGAVLPTETKKKWSRGCEQHVSFLYLLKPATDSVEFTQDINETDGIAWFSPEELDDLETSDNIRLEVRRAFTLIK